eukprot:scaffold103252_cov25-Tisochrysis_lutea.AAC.1
MRTHPCAPAPRADAPCHDVLMQLSNMAVEADLLSHPGPPGDAAHDDHGLLGASEALEVLSSRFFSKNDASE